MRSKHGNDRKKILLFSTLEDREYVEAYVKKLKKETGKSESRIITDLLTKAVSFEIASQSSNQEFRDKIVKETNEMAYRDIPYWLEDKLRDRFDTIACKEDDIDSGLRNLMLDKRVDFSNPMTVLAWVYMVKQKQV